MVRITKTSKTQQKRVEKVVLRRVRYISKLECADCMDEVEQCDGCGKDFDEDSKIFCYTENAQHLCDKCAGKLVK